METNEKIKRLKKDIIFGLLILLTVGIWGCSDNVLNEKLYSDIPLDGYYKSEGELELALNGVYAEMTDEGFYRALMWVVLSDVTGGTLRGGAESNGSGDKSNQNTPWNNFSWTSDAHEPSSIWGQHYDGINNANTLLHKLPNSDVSSESKKWYEGQTKFLRAYFYFDLVQVFGDVPLYVEPTLDLSEVDKPRTSVDEIYNQIESDLQDAESLLSPFNRGDHIEGRATSAAAKALLAKVHLQQRDWSSAASKAKEVIDMAEFELHDDFDDIHNPGNGTSKENIFSIIRGGEANANGNIYFAKAVYLWGPPTATLEDGTSVKFNNIKFPITLQVDQDFFDSTPNTYRKQQTMRQVMPYYYIGDRLVEDSIELYAPFVTKFRHMNFDTGSLHEGVPDVLIRYADVLLTYAEALNESNGGPSQEAYEAINEVRQRARAEGTANEQPESVYPDLSGLNQAQFRDSVISERAREFVGEGFRRSVLLRHDRFISNAKDRGVANAADHHKVFPLPGDEVSINPNLEQNSGY